MYGFLGYFLLGCWRAGVDKSIYSHEYRTLIALMRQLREGAGLRQSDLADLLGRSQQFVSKYESGERRLDLVEIRAICQTLGLTLGEFVKRYEKSLAK